MLHDEQHKYYLEIYTKSYLVEENKHVYNKKYSSYVQGLFVLNLLFECCKLLSVNTLNHFQIKLFFQLTFKCFSHVFTPFVICHEHCKADQLWTKHLKKI